MMINTQAKKARGWVILPFLACFLLLVTSVYQQISDKHDILALLQQGEPTATHYEELEGIYKTYGLYDQAEHLLSYGVIASASGYGGPITLLINVSQEGTLKNAVLVEDSETPLYLRKVLEAGYPENLIGKTVTQPLAAHEDIDSVSGATRTTDGIMLAVEKGMFQVGKNQLGLTVPRLKTFHFQWQDGLVLLMLLVAILASARNMKKLRPWISAAAVFVFGFMENSSLTIGNYLSIVALKMPAFSERPIWYVIVIGVLLVTLLWGRNFYCSWLCPFGAVQEGLYKALNLADYRPNSQLISYARKSRWLFLWLAAMLALFFNNPGIASFEPFSVFFDGDGNTSQWMMMLLILLFSIFILRFWCRCFCPMGVLLDFIASGRRKGQQLFRNKLEPEEGKAEKEERQGEEEPGWAELGPVEGEALEEGGMKKEVAASRACSGCQKGESKREQHPLSSGDKLVAAALAAIWILIIGALLQNMGII
ncbi:4Fe-4S binding protein [Desulfitobacterium hafniense]|uniref:FMN-binding domain-containing protein n=2 Tax=Desulfitobacterium hafniense TaxID=49338 RepID=Q24T02_DESHY|nr:4Fe-4S binding protein [Desulfitobacterium hafniense]EHL04650.1 FMN-binding domain protein [Desulfitobacterium hafniense DP7]BAE84840.1 hypothetical protein DSY3051 [Desulfitobacterium hafniense Y51]